MTRASHQDEDRAEHDLAEDDLAEQSQLVADSLSAGLAIMVSLTIVQRLVGFFRQLIICRILDPEELGRWNLAYSMIILAAPLIVLGIPGTYGRYSEHFRQKGQLHLFLRKTSLITLLLTLVGAVALLILAKPVAWLLFRDATQAAMVSTLAFALMSVISFNYFVELLTSLRQVKVVSWMRFACSVMFVTFSVSLLIFFRSAAVSIVVGYGAACLLTTVIGILVLLKTLRSTKPDTSQPQGNSLWAKLLPFAGWLWLADLLSNLFAAVDRYMIVHFADASANAAAATVGQYHSSRLIPDQMIALAVMSAAILLPYLSNNWEQGDRLVVHRRLNLSLKLYALAMTAAGVLLMLIAPWLFGSILGGKYAEGLSVIPWSIVACIWYGLYALTQTYLFCCERAGFSSIALAVGLISNMALNLLLLPILGLQGAVIATAISNGLALLLIGLFAKRFGMQWSHGMPIVMVLPVCIVHSSLLAVMILIGVAIAGTLTPLIFSDDEKTLLRQQLGHATDRLGAYLTQWRFAHRTTHSPN